MQNFDRKVPPTKEGDISLAKKVETINFLRKKQSYFTITVEPF